MKEGLHVAWDKFKDWHSAHEEDRQGPKGKHHAMDKLYGTQHMVDSTKERLLREHPEKWQYLRKRREIEKAAKVGR
jgi:hypothetical protein